MSDSNPTPGAPAASKSLADRITTDATANGKKLDWADEVENPSTEPTQPQHNTAATDEGSSLADAQKDGATTWMMRGELNEPEFDVNVQLADLQEDPSNPLYSVTSFQELGL